MCPLKRDRDIPVALWPRTELGGRVYGPGTEKFRSEQQKSGLWCYKE